MGRKVPEPLSRYRAISTSSADEFYYLVREIYGATDLTLGDPSALDVRANFVPLHDSALGFGGTSTAAAVHFGEEDFALLQLPLRGRGTTRIGRKLVTVEAGGACLTSPGQAAVLDREAGFEQLFLRVNSDALRRRLELLIGTPVRGGIEFEPADFTSPSMLAGLRHMIDLLVTHLDDEYSALSPLVLREMEQAIVLQLLLASRHNFSTLLDRDPRGPATAHLKRVEDYIESNWNRPILVEDLVEVAGVSARSLYNSFEKTHGCPPMMFVKRVRLARARELLTKGDEATSVVGVALACGFSNLGHFAKDYRSAFGELPSSTLRMSQGRSN